MQVEKGLFLRNEVSIAIAERGKAATKDVMGFAGGIVHMMFADVEESLLL